MMNVPKRTLKTLLSALGYRVVKTRKDVISMSQESFEKLIGAYEMLINRLDPAVQIPPNSRRPELLSRLLGTPISEAFYNCARPRQDPECGR